MKKNFILTIFIFIFILNSVLSAHIVQAYWGNEGDCNEHHGITLIDIPTDNNATIVLDGIASESFWSDPNNRNGSLIVPLATQFGVKIIHLNLTIIMTNEFLYLYCEWNDSTTLPTIPLLKDGIFFCWNINVPNFSANFWDGMSTKSMGGGIVDTWGWSIDGDSVTLEDGYFGTNGWYCDGSELHFNVDFGYQVNTGKSYSLELVRKLTTSDEYDFQINEHKLYKFNMGILDNGRHDEHAISWTYALDLREEQNPTSAGSPGSGENNKNTNNETRNINLNTFQVDLKLMIIYILIIVSVVPVSFIFIYKNYKIPQ